LWRRDDASSLSKIKEEEGEKETLRRALEEVFCEMLLAAVRGDGGGG
jgi:hypothetical protein